MLVTFLKMGIPAANIYYVSRGDITVRTARRVTLQMWLGLSVVGVIVGAFLVMFWGDTLFPDVAPSLLWFGIAVFPISLLLFLMLSLLQAKQDFVRFNGVLIAPAALTLVAAVILVWGLDLGVSGALVAYAVGQLIGTAVCLHAVSTHVEQNTQPDKLSQYARHAVGYGWKAHLSNVMTFFNYRLDVLLVNLFLGAVSTGIYAVSVGLAERLWMLSGAVSAVLLPRLASLHDDEKTRNALTPLVSRWTLLLTLIGGILVGFVTPWLITFLYGVQYQGAAQAFLWLLPGIVLVSFSRILANDLAARGRPDLNMNTSIVVVIANLVANLFLIPRMGINGAALATTFSYGIDTILKIYLYQRESGNRWYTVILFDRDDLALLGHAWEIFQHRLQSSR